ncbi:hypothetical protein ASZ78_005829 [Callipepla squamata]|uniref:G-protein coupled receptors family 2 profile 2 domain-containing protein n=1 Tax=Callipepla squamata TaxID=9009 RepID=A0A226MK84_CALSU|nr:hypothetical protein ASZ78_005829 [Callipepla squamata]
MLRVPATHPDCSIVLYFQEREDECLDAIRRESRMHSPNGRRGLTGVALWWPHPQTTPSSPSVGCQTAWDGVSCWPAVPVGQSHTVTCPDVPHIFKKSKGAELSRFLSAVLIYRNCTEVGWSPPSPPYYSACELEAAGNNNTEAKAKLPKHTTSFRWCLSFQKGYFITMKVLYTCGYSTSLVALLLAVAIFSCFRKLHCTRNSIHIHFFTSFILRGAAVLIKDAVLFSDDSADHCTMSTVKCKASIAFVQYSVLANFYWLLVEGMYLQTLLLLTFTSDRSYIWWYILIGWGEPCNPNPSRGSRSPSQELG